MLEKLSIIFNKVRSWLLRNGKTSYLSYGFLSVVSIILLCSGLFKIFGGDYSNTFFEQMCINSFYRVRIGFLEIVTVILLWNKVTSKIGFYLLLCLMGGAVAVHITSSVPGLQIPIFIVILTYLGIQIKNHGFKFRNWS